MSATMRRLEFGVTVEDYEHWSAEHLEQCERDDPSSYDDWVVAKLEAVMHDAGEKFVTEHPDLFRCGLT